MLAKVFTRVCAKSGLGAVSRQKTLVSGRFALSNALLLSRKPVVISFTSAVEELKTAAFRRAEIPANQRLLTRTRNSRQTAYVCI